MSQCTNTSICVRIEEDKYPVLRIGTKDFFVREDKNNPYNYKFSVIAFYNFLVCTPHGYDFNLELNIPIKIVFLRLHLIDKANNFRNNIKNETISL